MPAKKKKAQEPLSIKAGKSFQWDNPEEVRESISALEELGYQPLSLVQTAAMGFVRSKAFAHKKERVYALVHDDAQSVWVDLFCCSTAGDQCFAANNAVAPLLGMVAQRPVYFIGIRFPKVPVSLLHEQFLRQRPKGKWADVSLEALPGAFRVVSEADAKWQAENLDKNGEKKMQHIVLEAYQAARLLRSGEPAEELRFLLRQLELPEDAIPRLPQSLTAAASNGDLQAINQFLEAGADINEKSVGFASPLAAAAREGQLAAINLLLERGADPHRQSLLPSFSALATAAFHGYAAVVKRLLATNPPEAQRKAAARGAKKHKLVNELLAGRKVSDEDIVKAETTRSATKQAGSLKRLLNDMTILMGREPDLPPLTSAQREAAFSRVQELTRLPVVRASLAAKSKEHGSCLDLAVQTGNTELTRALLETSLPTDQISLALCTAASRRDRPMVRLLLKAGARPTEDGKEAIICGAEAGDVEIVRWLLEAGADPKARTEGGETAMTAAKGPFAKQIKELLKQVAGKQTPEKGSAIGHTEQPRKKVNLATARGTADFRDAMGQPEWSLAFIEASPELVAQEFARLHPSDRWHRDTAQRRLEAKPPVILIFRLRGHAWTILLRTVGWLQSEDIEELPEDARDLSKALRTRVMTYMAEDTSGCDGYELFKDGKSIEKAECTGDVTFTSSWRKRPQFGDKFPEPTFTELGIYLPECWMDSDGYEVKLLLGGVSPTDVERLDCFELKRKSK